MLAYEPIFMDCNYNARNKPQQQLYVIRKQKITYPNRREVQNQNIIIFQGTNHITNVIKDIVKN